MTKASRSSLLIATLFLAFAAAVLYIVQISTVASGILQLLILVAGTLVAGSVTAFQKFLEGNLKVARENFRVGEIAIRELRASAKQPRENPQLQRAPWDITSAQLLSTDKSLALAKIRIELEKQLRRIAAEAGIDITTRPVGLTTILRELVNREILSRELEIPVLQVSRVCNQAIHGAVVPDNVAARTVSLGSEIWEYLQGVHPAPQFAQFRSNYPNAAPPFRDDDAT